VSKIASQTLMVISGNHMPVYHFRCTSLTSHLRQGGQQVLPEKARRGSEIGSSACRALQVLKSVHTIFAEDVWHSRKLLTHYKITTHIKSYHAHNEAKRASIITSLLDRGLSVAVISDAGVPGVSDPGAAAVKAAIEASHKVVPIPGPCAAVTALVASGLPTTTFHFEGFLSAKRAARRKRLLELRLHIQACPIAICCSIFLLSNSVDAEMHLLHATVLMWSWAAVFLHVILSGQLCCQSQFVR
jgi:hypothetical protein